MVKIKQYLFYPSNFWPHKNHVYILDTLQILKDQYNIKINAVFTGMDKGNLSHIKSYSKKKNIYEQIHIYGFVNENELINIYLESLFVVVPTFLVQQIFLFLRVFL